jgi:aminoglycoside phosphotransferase (APT) family kinase protein
MSTPREFVDVERARQIVGELYPDVQQIEVVEHGNDNIVALVDSKCAIRFPRNEHAYVRNLYEREILPKLDDITVVSVPKLIASSDAPPYLETSFILGRHCSPEDVDAFTVEHQRAFGATVGTFAYQLHTSVPVADEIAFRARADFGEQFDDSWAGYFERVVLGGHFASTEQAAIARDYYYRWKAHSDVDRPQVVVHDDLHIDNMLFSDHQLVGILDFGDVNIGTAEQDLRQLYRMNRHVLNAAVAAYDELSGRRLDTELIEIWAIMQELGAYARRLSAGETDHPSFIRSQENLELWLPEGQWARPS